VEHVSILKIIIIIKICWIDLFLCECGKNNPKSTYLIDIYMGYVPCRGSVVSHRKPPNIMLLIKEELI